MFIRPNFFKYLIKQAAKRYLLRILNDDEHLIIDGGIWTMVIDYETMPNYAKACLVEWCGEIPAPGIQFAVMEEGNQIEMETLSVPEIGGRLYKQTTMLIWNNRVLQNAQGDLALCNFDYTDTISQSEIESARGESDVEGPYVDLDHVTWKYNRMLLQCRRSFAPEYQHVLDVLKGVNLGPAFSKGE